MFSYVIGTIEFYLLYNSAGHVASCCTQCMCPICATWMVTSNPGSLLRITPRFILYKANWASIFSFVGFLLIFIPTFICSICTTVTISLVLENSGRAVVNWWSSYTICFILQMIGKTPSGLFHLN